jgi:hypothetical protein
MSHSVKCCLKNIARNEKASTFQFMMASHGPWLFFDRQVPRKLSLVGGVKGHN